MSFGALGLSCPVFGSHGLWAEVALTESREGVARSEGVGGRRVRLRSSKELHREGKYKKYYYASARVQSTDIPGVRKKYIARVIFQASINLPFGDSRRSLQPTRNSISEFLLFAISLPSYSNPLTSPLARFPPR